MSFYSYTFDQRHYDDFKNFVKRLNVSKNSVVITSHDKFRYINGINIRNKTIFDSTIDGYRLISSEIAYKYFDFDLSIDDFVSIPNGVDVLDDVNIDNLYIEKSSARYCYFNNKPGKNSVKIKLGNKVFDSIAIASRKLLVCESTIYKSLKSGKKTRLGTFKYVNNGN